MKKFIPLTIVSVVLLAGLVSFKSFRSISPTALPANGEKAVNLIYRNPEDKLLALSELKGKIVLLDFWASWCGPCRRTNPYWVELYSKYHGKKFKDAKDFEIFSVSLDQSKQAWVAAIAKDNLKWAYHVSDLGGWSSEGAAKYGVNSIPRAFLIDADGVIIGSNLHPEDVDAELQKRLK